MAIFGATGANCKPMILNFGKITPETRRVGLLSAFRRSAKRLCRSAVGTFTVDGLGKSHLLRLFFIHVGKHWVRIAGATCHPDGPWVEQQARNLFYELAERNERASALIHDRDTKFTARFKTIVKSEGVEVVRIPYRAPNLN